MPLPFNKSLDLKLLALVKENSILYNTKHPRYLDFDAREVVWQKIGDALNRSGNSNLTSLTHQELKHRFICEDHFKTEDVLKHSARSRLAPTAVPLKCTPVTPQYQVCKARWINIRDMMRRKIRERLRNPGHRSYNYKYEEEMAFMIPYFKDANTASEEYTDFIEEEPPCDISASDVFADSIETYQPKESKPMINSMKSKEDFQNQFQDLSPTDPIDVFLITIGSTLRRFSPYYLNQAKSKIFQVVQDYELQQIMNKDDHLNASSSDAR